MHTLSYLLSNQTAVLALRGSFFLALLFAFCFLCIHLITYFLSKRAPRATPPEPEKEKAPPPAAPEPIYYIVERKQRRSKAKYGEPKEIKFK